MAIVQKGDFLRPGFLVSLKGWGPGCPGFLKAQAVGQAKANGEEDIREASGRLEKLSP